MVDVDLTAQKIEDLRRKLREARIAAEFRRERLVDSPLIKRTPDHSRWLESIEKRERGKLHRLPQGSLIVPANNMDN